MLLLLALSAIVWVIVGSVGYWARLGWLPADGAGWAQAIGAFVAITVAIAVPYHQNYQQRIQRDEADRKARLDGINATLALMSHVKGVTGRLSKALSNRYRVSVWGAGSNSVAHDLKQAAAMLREIPVTSISNEVVHFLVGLREIANYGEYAAGVVLQGGYYDESPIIKKANANVALIDRWIEELELLEQDIRDQ
ncbi:hypothetical protein [Pseudomonas putida]|nr:hypothetical protein [Pseudomonas putida]